MSNKNDFHSLFFGTLVDAPLNNKGLDGLVDLLKRSEHLKELSSYASVIKWVFFSSGSIEKVKRVKEKIYNLTLPCH